MKKNEEELERQVYSKRTTYILYACIALLLIANIITVIFYIQEKKYGLQGTMNLTKFLSPMRLFVADKDVVVNFNPLRTYLNDTYEVDPDISVYFEFLNTGANISISKDAEFFPASLLKVPVAMAAIKKIEKGTWKWENELVLMAGDKDDHFGDLYKQPIGTRFTIEYLIKKILEDSDNTAYYMVLRNLEKDEVQAVWNHLGLQDFFSKDGKISAKRYAVVIRSLYHAAFLSKEDSSKVLEWLTKTPFTEYLEQGLPKGVEFSHKIGVSTDESVYMDAGIVYLPNRPYLLIVMTHGKNKKEAEKVMKDISLKTYEYIIGYDEKHD